MLNVVNCELNMIETSMLRVDGEHSVPLNFLVDSGASHSLVHPRQRRGT